jgi:hypothetical protein
VTILNWREVDFPSVVVAGLAAGYVMQVVGVWAGSLPWFVSVDIADFGRRYMVSDRPSAWVIGFLSHLANSVLLVFVWAALIEPNLSWSRPLEGLLWGIFLAVVLAGGLLSPLTGMGFMGRKTGSHHFAATNLLVHAIWGALIGVIYVPR